MWKKIIFLTITLLIPSCKIQIDCPGYPEKYLVWMPYIQGEEFSLTDGIDTFQLIVETTDITKAYTIKEYKYLANDCSCRANATITSDFFPTILFFSENREDYAADFVISFLTPYHEFPNTVQSFQFQDNNGDTIYSFYPYEHNELLSSYNNGYKIFNDVLKIESDTLLSDILIYQIYIAKRVGIIQFKDRFNHKTWSLIKL